MRSERSGLAGAVRRLHSTLSVLHDAPTPRKALPDICAGLRDVLDARTIVAHLVDGDQVEAVAYAGDASAEDLIGQRSPLSDWTALLDNSPDVDGVHECIDPRAFLDHVVHEHVDTEPAMHGNDEQWGALNLFIAPIWAADQIIGLMTATYPAGAARPDPAAVPLIALVAGQLSVAFHHQTFVQRSSDDHLALRLSEERFRLAFDNAPIGMAEFIEGPQGLEVARINRAAGLMFGVSVLGAQHEPVDRVLTVVQGEPLGDLMIRLLKDDRRGLRLEVPFVGADGGEFWGLVEAALLMDGGGRPGVLCQIVDITQSKADERELTIRAQHDPLTGLPNRLTVLDHLQTAVRDARATDQLGALLFCDLDSFKQVNDRHGHLVGDDALASIATRLHQTVRKSDVAGRFGGDEFVVVAFPVTQEEAQALGERIQAALCEPMVLDGAALRVGVSIGIAMITGAVEASEVLRRADAAMYAVRTHQRRPSFVVDTA